MTPSRRALAVLGTVALAGAVALTLILTRERSRGAPSDPEDRPNFVVVMTDDQGLTGLEEMRATQRLIADRGVEFENFIANYPLCSPSRASFLTGQYPHNHGVRGNHPPDGGIGAFDAETTMPLALERSGYRTALIGKYMNGYPNRAEKDPSFIPPGFSYWFGGLDSRMFNWRANENGEVVRFGGRSSDYLTDVEAERGAGFIASSAEAGEPFFLTMATLAPHKEAAFGGLPNPRAAPRDRGEPAGDGSLSPSVDESDVSDKPSSIRELPRLGRAGIAEARARNRYRLRSLRAVDDMVATLVGELRDQGELDDTYFIFTSDNGLVLGEHRASGKEVLYEETLRLPLLIRGPGIPSGEVRRQPASMIDLAPTILTAAGADPLVPTDGVSLFGAIADRREGWNRTLLVENGDSVGLRTDRRSYVEHGRPGRGPEFELYDLGRDPYELDNVYDSAATSDAERERLARRIDQLQGCVGAACR